MRMNKAILMRAYKVGRWAVRIFVSPPWSVKCTRLRGCKAMAMVPVGHLDMNRADKAASTRAGFAPFASFNSTRDEKGTPFPIYLVQLQAALQETIVCGGQRNKFSKGEIGIPLPNLSRYRPPVHAGNRCTRVPDPVPGPKAEDRNIDGPLFPTALR